MSDKLSKILSLCKCGVFLTVNEHRDYYDTAEKALEEAMGYECTPEINDDVRSAMIETNTIIKLQFYPECPGSFFLIWHNDLDAILTQALEILNGHN